MSAKKKILVTYATAGIGHKKAALAVFEALKSKYGDAEVKLVDVLDYTNFLFKETYCALYLFLINRLTFLWGFLYYSLNFKFVHLLLQPLRRVVHVLNSARLIRFMLEYKPDIVISTHFLHPDICCHLKRKYRMNMHVINVITDYRAHSFWVSPGVDTYAVGHERVRDELVNKWGVPAANVKATGIPVETKFSAAHDKNSIRAKLGISPGSFAVLLLSGGYGVGPVRKILEKLNKADFALSAITVCGHNKGLYEELEKFRETSAIKIVNLGFVDNVDKLIAASDICIGKAGGMSTSEALAEGVPFIFVRPIPGQEKANAEFLIKIGAGLRLKKVSRVLDVIQELRSSPDKMKALKENTKRAGRPNAARDIAQLAKAI